MLSASDLTKSYGRRLVLKGISLTLPAAGVAVLLGPSGCGKSTLLRALALLDPPDSGTVTVDDVVYRFPQDRNLRRGPWPLLTVVFQQHFLWPHLSLRANIDLPCQRHVRPKARARIAELCDRFGIVDLLDRYPNQVSIGERQRTALVRALALQPRYVLIDEVTASLDIEQTGKILSYFLSRDPDRPAALIVTHLIGFARKLATLRTPSSVLFMDHGEIVEVGDATCFESPASGRFRDFLAVAGEINEN